MNLLERMVEIYNKPDPNPYLFQVGQTVRVTKNVINDGQTPECWAGAIVVVERRKCTGLHKEHWYVLRHPNGAISEFNEDELDFRYSRKDKPCPSAPI